MFLYTQIGLFRGSGFRAAEREIPSFLSKAAGTRCECRRHRKGLFRRLFHIRREVFRKVFRARSCNRRSRRNRDVSKVFSARQKQVRRRCNFPYTHPQNF